MKNIFKIFIILFTGSLMNACDDFLEEKPRDEISLGQFFSEPSHAQNAVNSLYRIGAPMMYGSGGVYQGKRAMYGPYLSGFFDNEYKGQEPYIGHAQQLSFTSTNIDGFSNGIWSDLYLAISRANNAIKYIPDTPGLAEKDANKLLAEARFFRAYAYYFLVRLYGEVPLVEEPYESLENIYVAKSPLADVYGLIENDLLFAVNQGGLSSAPMVNNGYRITKGAAQALLAEVYLTMSGFPLQSDHYAEAATMAKAVINSGSYSLTQHDTEAGSIDMENSAYNKIRREEALSNEYVYMVEYLVGISTTEYPQWSYPVAYAGDVEYSITNGAYQPVEEFMWGYDADNDLRAQNKQFFHTTFNDDEGNVLSTFEPTPYIWHDDQALFQTATSGKDALAISYADVLLIAAEAIAESEGVNAEAAGYLAEVRGRAYWKEDMADIETDLSGLSSNNFVEEVWKERYRELVFEFPLWFDMIRTRTYPLTSNAGDGEITFVPLVGQENTWGKTFQEKHLFIPIPQREIQRNPMLQ